MSTAPQAPAQSPDETIVLRDNFIAEGRTVPAGNGWTWIVQGWGLFTKAPGTWIGMALVFLLIQLVLGMIPLVGMGVSLLMPVFAAGLIIAARTIDQGGSPRFAQLFAGFKHRFGDLVLLGVISLVVGIVIGVIAVALVGWDLMLGNAAADVHHQRMLLGVLVFVALTLPLVMALWFAPPLIVFHELGAVDAMKSSFAGCLKNLLPFLLYGVILLVPTILATLPILLGWLVLLPVLTASVYTAYRDIYFNRSAV